MPRKRNTGGMILPIGIVCAIVVGVIWTCLTGAVWQFVPIVAACVMALGTAKALNSPKRET